MSFNHLVSNIKGTTSLRLFLFLSIGVVMSHFVSPITGFISFIILVSFFVLAIIFHFTNYSRLSVVTIYIFLFSYGLLITDTQLSIDNSQLSIVKNALIAYQGAYATPANAPLLAALTLGDSTSIAASLVTDFRTAGVAHVLVVSGMHVGFIYLFIAFFLHRLPFKRVTAILGLFMLWSYAAIVGFTPSVCRAVFMFSVMLIVRVVGERYRSFQALFLAAFLQLLITPTALFDVGFQLSYTAVLSILIFYPLLSPISVSSASSEGDSNFTFARRLLSLVLNPIRLTISAQILTAPLVAYYFGQFPLYFVLTNLALTLLVPVIFIGGFLLFVPYLGELIAYPLNLLLDLLRMIVSFVASLPVSLVQVRITILVLILIYLLIALVVCYAYCQKD